MTFPNTPRKKDTKPISSPVVWGIGAAFFVALLGVLFFYDGKSSTTSSSGANPTNVVTGQPSK